MNVHFEATLIASHEGTVVLEPDEAAEYQALGNAEDRYEWLKNFVSEVVFDGDFEGDREVGDGAFWYVDDDEADR